MSFKFTWPHEASQVFVTGTFDNWSQSVRLDRTATAHEKEVQLPKTDEKILYKVRAVGRLGEPRDKAEPTPNSTPLLNPCTTRGIGLPA